MLSILDCFVGGASSQWCHWGDCAWPIHAPERLRCRSILRPSTCALRAQAQDEVDRVMASIFRWHRESPSSWARPWALAKGSSRRTQRPRSRSSAD